MTRFSVDKRVVHKFQPDCQLEFLVLRPISLFQELKVCMEFYGKNHIHDYRIHMFQCLPKQTNVSQIEVAGSYTEWEAFKKPSARARLLGGPRARKF